MFLEGYRCHHNRISYIYASNLIFHSVIEHFNGLYYEDDSILIPSIHELCWKTDWEAYACTLDWGKMIYVVEKEDILVKTDTYFNSNYLY